MQRQQLDDLIAAGRTVEARNAYARYCDAHPEDSDAVFALGLISLSLGELGHAEECFRFLLRREPGSAEAFYNLGRVFDVRGHRDEAIACFRRAVELRDDFAEAHSKLGNALAAQGRVAEAAPELERALHLGLNFDDRRLYLGRKPVDEERIRAYMHSALLFLAAYNVLYPPDRMLEAHRDWDRSFGGEARARTFRHERGADPDRRLRIGYVSPEFKRNPVSRFFEPVLAGHDKDRVEVYCYAELGSAQRDAVTERLEALADAWRSTAGMTDEAVARQIHEDRIDILVDLAGHTNNNRLRAFALRPAPVQATYLGYCTTTGLGAMDYWITDEVLHPADTVERAVEEIHRLPRCWLCYQPDEDAPPVAPHTDPASGVVFGSFNQLLKLTPQTIALWSRILRALPDARLVLKSPVCIDVDAVHRRVAAQFGEHGVDGGRIRVLPQTETYLDEYNTIDIALDPSPRTGGATTADALWMGVPVVSLAGERYIERQGASMLSAVGLSGLVAADEEEYVSIAVGLAGDPERLAGLRSTLRGRMAKSALCDGPGLARTLEDAYRDMWKRYLS